MSVLLCSLLLAITPFDVEAGVTTKKDEIIHGILVSTTVQMDTTFGTASIDTDTIISIEFGETDIVTTKGPTVLRGSLQLDSVDLRTDSGLKTVRRSDMKTLRVSQHAPPTPGEITDGVHWNQSTYHLRAPKDFDPGRQWPAIVFLHGASSNAEMFIRGICARWPDIGARYLLIGINGTVVSESSTPDVPKYYYSFINFTGRSKYEPITGSERDSPVLVSEIVTDLKQRLPLSKVFISGHSQGGFMTYSTFMNFPELFDGALPSAGGMMKYAAVDAFTEESLRARQRELPVAIVHATNDDIIDFSKATEAMETMRAAGFENVELFQNDTAGHRFLRLPYEEALQWLEKASGLRPD